MYDNLERVSLTATPPTKEIRSLEVYCIQANKWQKETEN